MRTIFVFLFAIIFVSPAFAQEPKAVKVARKAYADLQQCKSDNVSKQFDTVVGLVVPEQIGTTRETLADLAMSCIKRRFQPEVLVQNINSGKDRSKSLVKLAYFLEQARIPVTDLPISPADQQEVLNLLRMRDEMMRRLYSFPTWYPRRN